MHADILCFCGDVIRYYHLFRKWCHITWSLVPDFSKTWGTSDPVTWSITPQKKRNLESRDVTGICIVPVFMFCISCVPAIVSKPRSIFCWFIVNMDLVVYCTSGFF